MERFLCLLIGYLCGNFLTAELVTRRLSGQSAFDTGSGNPGMANIALHCGAKPALLVLAGDLGKTFLACLLCRRVLFPRLEGAALWAGLGCALGHDFPCWHRFRGGKGVACTCAALVCARFPAGLISCLCGLLAVLLTQYLAAGGVCIPAVFFVLALWGRRAEEAGPALLLLALALFSFRRELNHILAGTEPRLDLSTRFRRGR